MVIRHDTDFGSGFWQRMVGVNYRIERMIGLAAIALFSLTKYARRIDRISKN